MYYKWKCNRQTGFKDKLWAINQRDTIQLSIYPILFSAFSYDVREEDHERGQQY